jgi:rhamnosyltransferase subunit B
LSFPGRHIVLTTIGSLGDLHPMMALGIELQRRGHRATIATTEAYRKKIEATNLGFHALRPEGSPEDEVLLGKVMDLKRGPEFMVRELLMPHLRATYDDLLQIAREADFIVAGEIMFPAPLVAETLGLRWASVILSPAWFFSVHDPSVIAPLPWTKYLHNAPRFLHRLLIELGKQRTRVWVAPVQALRRALGLKDTDHPLFSDKFSPHLTLALFSPAFAARQPDWPASTVQAGFVFYDDHSDDEATGSRLAAFLEGGEPPIVFTLGSAAVLSAGDFFVESARAAQQSNRRALLLAGKQARGIELPASAAAFEYAPYSAVLPRAAAVVHQGGVGTTAQALRAGVPQLVVPYAFDQPDNAARIERLGLGRSIARRQYSAKRAALLLDELVGRSRYAQRAADVARLIRAERGVAAACDAIEGQLQLRRG